jgi:hypothetical protein
VSRFVTPLVLELLDEHAGTWRHSGSFIYDSDILGRIEIPDGHVTDLASYPDQLLGMFGRTCGAKAGAVHDFLYDTKPCDRETADAVLKEAMLASGHEEAVAQAFYEGVRLGGASHWDPSAVVAVAAPGEPGG